MPKFLSTPRPPKFQKEFVETLAGANWRWRTENGGIGTVIEQIVAAEAPAKEWRGAVARAPRRAAGR